MNIVIIFACGAKKIVLCDKICYNTFGERIRRNKRLYMWIVFACLSSVFAGLTAILSKLGVKDTDSDVATAIRTSVVLVLSFAVTFITGEYRSLPNVSTKSLIFLIISGFATGASWICYFKALSCGDVSKVTAVDKSSVILTILFALAAFPDERVNWQIKIVCLVFIGVGTYLMADFKKADDPEKKKSATWLLFAVLSAVFAAATSILAKIGIENVPSNLATSIRTCVVIVMAWLIVFCRKKTALVKAVPKRDLLFLCLSGVATAGSWLCYYYAIAYGQVSVVVPIDKLSVLLTAAFSVIVLKEKLKPKAVVGLFLLLAGTICMAIFA